MTGLFYTLKAYFIITQTFFFMNVHVVNDTILMSKTQGFGMVGVP